MKLLWAYVGASCVLLTVFTLLALLINAQNGC